MPMKRPAPVRSRGSLQLDALAHRWRVSRRQIRRLLQVGNLPFEQVDGQLRVPLEAINDYERVQGKQVR